MFLRFSRKAFTLIELMIVIAIIGILIAAMSSFNVDAGISQQRVEKWANEISDMIRDAQQDAVLGKVGDASNIENGERIVDFVLGASSEYNYFLSWTTSGRSATRNLLPWWKKWISSEGIEWDKNYAIEKIEVSPDQLFINSNNTSNKVTWKDATKLELFFQWNNRSAKADTSISYTIASYRITLKYKDFRRYIYGSVYSWNIDIKNQAN